MKTIKLWDLEERKLVETANHAFGNQAYHYIISLVSDCNHVSDGCGMVVLNYPYAFAIAGRNWKGVQVWDMERGVKIRHILEDEKGYRFISSNGKLLTFCEEVHSWSSGTDDGRLLKLGVYDVRQLGDPEVETENLWTKTFEYPGDYLSKHVTAAANSHSLIVDHRSEKFDIIKFENAPGFQEPYVPYLRPQAEGHQKLVFVMSLNDDKKYAIDNTPTEDWSFLFKFWAFKYEVAGTFPVFVGINTDAIVVEEDAGFFGTTTDIDKTTLKFRAEKNTWTPLEGWKLNEKDYLSFHVTDQPGDGRKLFTVSHAEDGTSKISEGDCENDSMWTKDFIFWAKDAEGVEFIGEGCTSGVVPICDSVKDKSIKLN